MSHRRCKNYSHLVIVIVRDSKVGLAISVEVSNRYGLRIKISRIAGPRLKCAVAVAQKDPNG